MKPFRCEINVFNGRFWRPSKFVKIEATSMAVAFAKSARHIRSMGPNRSRITKAYITIEALKPVKFKEAPDGGTDKRE